MANIGIYGGAFNPPHKGHSLLIRQAMFKLKLDKLIVIPSYISPHKEVKDPVPSDMRFKMAQLAFRDIKDVTVSDIEINRKGVSYTIDTLLQLKEIYPHDKFFLIMGDDMFVTLETWKNPQKLFELATISVLLRDKNMADEVLSKAIEFKLKYNAVVAFVKNIVYEISSSEIRDRFAEKYNNLDNDVLNYIVENGLYKNEFTPLIKSIEDYLKENISPYRLSHIYGTRDEAILLAKKYNCDILKANIAALLHDITKELDYEGQIKYIKSHSLTPDSYDKAAYKLLHAVTGEEMAKEKFHILDIDLLNAIRYHTTGRPNMSLLEKIIFVADFIEPTRDYEGVDKLREYADIDLDLACLKGLEFTIETLKSENKQINQNTIDAYNYYIKGVSKDE